MQPFDPPGQGKSGRQIDFDARRVHYLECLAKRAIIKSAAFDAWNAAEKLRDPVPKPGSDPVEMVSRYDAGYSTVCNAVHDLGLRKLDPGLDAVRDSIRELLPEERAAQQRRWLDQDDRLAALGRTLLARAYPERTDELFGWQAAGLDAKVYWTPKITSVHMEYLLETADFGANELIRILYMLPETPEHLQEAALLWRDPRALGRDVNFPDTGGELLRAQFTSFKYWFDDPFRCSEFSGKGKSIREQATPADYAINFHEKMDPGSDMTYWSENHRLLFAAAEYLAGQYWPADMFTSARKYRKEGPNGPPRTGDMTGQEHVEHAKRRVLRWLNERLRLGFAEWSAPGYYVEDVLPLLNLADFAVDKDIRTRAAMVLDLLVMDLAINQMGGAFAGSAGRSYFEHKNCVWGQSIGDSIELLFGTRGHFVEMSNAAIFFATSPAYRPPDALIAIGARPPQRFTSRGRVSITFEESKEFGVGFSTPDDMEFWWSRAGYATKQTILGSRQVAADAGLLDTPPFKDIIPMIESAASAIETAEDVGGGILGGIGGAVVGFAVGGPVGAVAGATAGAIAGAQAGDFSVVDAADLASVITEGSVLSRANLYTHHSGGAALASVQNFRPGQLNFQSWPCVATLSNGAMVWTTYPSAGTHVQYSIGSSTWALIGAIVGGPIGMIVGAVAMPDVELVNEDLFKADDHNGPNWWTGNAVQPRVVQQRGAAIIAYQAKEIQKLLFGQRTHAWFPKHQFEQTRGPEPARCNFDSARWFFGCVGDSYVALLSALETTWTDNGPWKDSEIRAEGPNNIFITQIGSQAEFGSFENFVARVSHARVRIAGLFGVGQLACSYDVPFGERLVLEYDDGPSYGGQPLADDNFPRLHNPFTRIAWQQDRYAIQYDRQSVVHDVVAGKRTLGGRLDHLDHDTPLTFYAQSMGVNRDRALDHLIVALRERAPELVGLSEMWSAGDRERLRAELAGIYPFSVDGGGLLLLSRHPIVARRAAQGVLHARIQPRGHPCPVDVFLTHTAVEAQIRHLAAFIQSTRDAVSPAILLGDFNVDSYDYLRSTLGNPLDLSPATGLKGRVHIFGFPGLLYAHHAVVEPSEHDGVEVFIDTTAESFPSERAIQTLRVCLVQVQCLKTTSGFGDDEVKFSLSVKGASGVAAAQSTAEIEDVTDGTVHAFDLPALVLGDPGEEVDIAVEGWEIDSLSADDSLGRSTLTYGRDELLAIADRGALLTAVPMLRGDGSEYVVQIEIGVA